MTFCARCGLVEVEGAREDMPMCLACEREILVEEMNMNEFDAFSFMVEHRNQRIRELEAELQAYRNAPTVPCPTCRGRDTVEECYECGDTDWGHKCPPPRRCDTCGGAGILARIVNAVHGGSP